MSDGGKPVTSVCAGANYTLEVGSRLGTPSRHQGLDPPHARSGPRRYHRSSAPAPAPGTRAAPGHRVTFPPFLRPRQVTWGAKGDNRFALLTATAGNFTPAPPAGDGGCPNRLPLDRSGDFAPAQGQTVHLYLPCGTNGRARPGPRHRATAAAPAQPQPAPEAHTREALVSAGPLFGWPQRPKRAPASYPLCPRTTPPLARCRV